MRLDLFLKASRFSPRRTVAQKLCDAGLVSLNGVRAKSGHTVRPGDEISIRQRDTTTTLRVVSVPGRTQISRDEAGRLYEVLSKLVDADVD